MSASVALDIRFESVYNDTKNTFDEYPALHSRWVSDIQFVLYEAPPLDVEDNAGVEEWRERVSYICDDLHRLLSFSHQHFWCQVIFDESLHRCIDSYLKYAPRCYDVVYQLPREIQTVQNELHRLVYMACVRMATYKESKDDYITPEEFGKIIYENFIFDIPKLMDLCVLYGSNHEKNPGNKPLLSKMIGNIFHEQPSYMDDLSSVVPTILQVFHSVCQTCGLDLLSSPTGSPQKLGSASGVSLVDMDERQLEDVVFYLSDTSQTLWQFLDVYPPATAAFLHDDSPAKLASLYEVLFPVLMEAVTEREWPSEGHRHMITKQIRQSQLCLLKICRIILSHNYLSPLMTDKSQEETELCVEGYLHLMTAMLADKRFLCHLEQLYPFREDRDVLLQCTYPVDETRLQYIVDAVNEAIFMYSPNTESGQLQAQPPTACEGIDEAASNTVQNGGGACAKSVTKVELDSMISLVHDLLPDLGDGFIQICLEKTDYDTEKTINMLLEDNLPTSIQDCPRDLPREVGAEPDDDSVNVLTERRNIYDDDEFDVFSRDYVDTTRIHRGKKEQHVGGDKAVLDDKSIVAALRPLYDKYGNEDVESMYDVVHGGYEDEYDDTYDTNMIGATDTDELDELTNKRPFTVPRVLGGVQQSEETDDDGTNEEEESTRRDQFVEDPAKIRQRQEERRAARDYNKRGKAQQRVSVQQKDQTKPRSGHGQDERDTGSQRSGTHDVKGNLKGQGQSSDVLRNRAWKEKNKGTRVNHNRKNLADKKRRC